MLVPIILSGGSGTRLWPLSNKKEPKQFLTLLGKNTLIQETLLRVAGCENIAAPIIVNSHQHVDLLKNQLSEIACTPSAIILEPVPRNTAPAIVMAALVATANGDDPILMVLPSDHVIREQKLFASAVKVAQHYAEKGCLVTFGIKPNKPETGYGYIKQGEKLGDGAYQVAQFVEKPDSKTAQQYLNSGEYHWNSGMFVFKASVLLSEMQKFEPEIFNACQKTFESHRKDDIFYHLDEQQFSCCPKLSVDYAVMEKTDKSVVVPMDVGWSDIGSWSALLECCKCNEDGNITIGDVIVSDVKNAYLRSETKKLVVIGIKNVVVVETEDAILVTHKDASDKLKKIVENS